MLQTTTLNIIFTKPTIIFNMKYRLISGNYLSFHPSLNYYHDNKYLVMNQITIPSLKIYDINNETPNFFKLKLNSEAVFQQIDAYMTPPHIVNSSDVKFTLGKELENYLNKPKSLNDFIFIQPFLIYLTESLLKYEPIKKDLLIDKNYSLREYIELNFNKFDDNVQNGMEKILNFYDKNTSFFLNEKESFLSFLNKAAIQNSQERNELL